MSASPRSIPDTASWLGFDALRYLFIFGDSYSSVSPRGIVDIPTKENPLGVVWPGTTWCEEGMPNWVGHLISSSREQENELYIFDYAIGGQTVAGVQGQVDDLFLRGAGSKPTWAQWDDASSLFVFWVGINDCALSLAEDAPTVVAYLFELASEVYSTGGRNFMFIDVPPIARSPAISRPTELSSAVYDAWNTALQSQIQTFKSTHDNTSTFLFSAYDTFTRILDEPAKYGFNPKDVKKCGGEIWVDYLHPTSAVHTILAKEIEQFLKAQPPA